MGLNASFQQFVEILNELNKQLNQNQTIEILYQSKATDPEWTELMVNANMNIFVMSYEESVFYFKSLENLEKISHTNGLSLATILVHNHKSVSVSIIVGNLP
jgi:hypothetical protein